MDYRSENKKDIADSGIKLLNKKTPQNWTAPKKLYTF